jgi:hypothetical protein
VAASSLGQALKHFLPEAALGNPGASCKEKRKSVSFSKKSGDFVCCLDLKEAIKTWPDWPEGQASCDCLFVCGQEGRDEILVLLAELKGDNTDKAMEQFRATAKLFCKGSTFVDAGHGRAAKLGYKPGSCGLSHGKIVLAVIASPSGGRAASSWQNERKQLRTQGIKLLDRQPAQKIFSVDELYRAADRVK